MGQVIVNLYEKQKEKVLYLIFGVLTTIFSIALYYLLTRTFNLGVYVSSIISWILAVLFAYVTNKLYVFSARNTKFIKEIISFYAFRLLSLIVDLIIMFIFVELIKIDDFIVKIFSNVIVIILNYVFSKLFVFKGGLK